MEARLKTSLKWTALPKEYIEKVGEVFESTFKDRLEQDESFAIDGRIYPEEVLMRVGIHKKGRLTQANFETSIGYNPEKQDAIEQIYLSIDALASMVDEYLTSLETEENLDFPRVWTEYDFTGKKLFLRFSTMNADLEAQADALLGIASADLVQEQQELDALDFAEVDAQLSDEDEEELFDNDDEEDSEDDEESGDTSRPSLFSNKTKH